MSRGAYSAVSHGEATGRGVDERVFMGRRLKYNMPGPDWRRDFDECLQAGWSEMFWPEVLNPQPLVVEIGFGRGEFLIDLATNSPEAAFLGIEISFKRVLKMARRLAAMPIENVRLIESKAERVVGQLLEKETVAQFWINFPDPWPKLRHAPRRLMQPPFVRELSTRLVEGGLLCVATDDADYAEQIHESLSGESSLENMNAPEHWTREVPGRMHTGYESEWRAEGRPLHFFNYRRNGLGCGDG